MNPNGPFQGRGFGFAPVHGYYQGGTPTLAWVTFALVLLLVLTVFALLVARFSRGGRHFGGPRMRMRGGRPDPLEIVRMRFASGQISREEYLQATSDLTPAPAPAPPPAS